MWIYENEPYDPEVPPEDMQGFVYRITDLTNGMMYIGKKTLWSTRRVTVKGRKNKKKIIKESDWRKYFGSNNELKQQVQKLGEDKYKREILKFCRTKGECSYYEAKLQFQYDVLMSDDYYNEYIQCRIHAKHLRKNDGSE
jgi:hypothetical protein